MIYLRLILERLCLRFVAVLGVLAVLFMLVDAVLHSRIVQAYGAGEGMIWTLTLLHAPLHLLRVMPFAALVASMLVMVSLHRRGEWLFLQSCAQKPFRGMIPFVLFGLLAAFGLVAVQEGVAPGCLREYHRLVNLDIKKRQTWQGDPFSGQVVVASSEAFWWVENGLTFGKPQQLTAWMIGSEGLPISRLDAEQMIFNPDEGMWRLGRASFRLDDGSVLSWTGQGMQPPPAPEAFVPQTLPPAAFSSWSLPDLAAHRHLQGLAEYPVWTEAGLRFSLVILVSCLALIPYLGVSKAKLAGRGRMVAGLLRPGFSGVLSLLALALGYALAQKGVLSPMYLPVGALAGLLVPWIPRAWPVRK